MSKGRRFRKEKKRKWKEKKEGWKERNAKERRKERKKRREVGRPWLGPCSPAATGVGRSGVDKALKEREVDGASVVQNRFLEFCKWCFGGRTYSSLEREWRGEEDGMVGGG